MALIQQSAQGGAIFCGKSHNTSTRRDFVMKAAVLEEFNAPLNVTDVPEPELTVDGAIIRVKACGICRSDWHGWKGCLL